MRWPAEDETRDGDGRPGDTSSGAATRDRGARPKLVGLLLKWPTFLIYQAQFTKLLETQQNFTCQEFLQLAKSLLLPSEIFYHFVLYPYKLLPEL
jgi:hypothetical protein